MSYTMKTGSILCLSLLSLLLVSSSAAPKPKTPCAFLKACQDYGATSFIKLVKAAGLEATLCNPSYKFTAFIPANRAIQIARVSPDQLGAVLNNHIIPGAALTASQLLKRSPFQAASQQQLAVYKPKKVAYVSINGSTDVATVLKADIKAGKVILHLVDRVLVQGASTSIPAPQPSPSPAHVPAPSGCNACQCYSVVDLLRGRPDLSVFLGFIKNTGFFELLSNTDLIATVFAPTNAAIIRATTEQHGIPSNVEALLKYTISPGQMYFLTNGTSSTFQTLSVTTLLGPSRTLNIVRQGLSTSVTAEMSAANVVEPDLRACKAVVHLVDNVLVPDLTRAVSYTSL